MRTVVTVISLFLSTYGYCAATSSKSIMEQVPSTGNTIHVDVNSGRVNIATRTYTGGLPSVGLHVSSNVVIDTPTVQNAVVIYATGSVTALSFYGDGSNLTGITGGGGGIASVTHDSTLGGLGTPASRLGVDFSTITTRFNSVATATTTLGVFLSTAGPWMQSSAASTTTFATFISTQGPWNQQVAASTATFGVFMSTMGPWSIQSAASSTTFANFISTSGPWYISSALSTTTLNSLVTGNGAGFYISTNSVIRSTVSVLGSAFSVGGSSFIVNGGSATVAYSLTAGTLNTASSVTASAFFGDGSHLTGITGGSGLAFVTTDGTLGGQGTASIPLGVNFSTITTALNNVATATTTIGVFLSTAGPQFNSIATSTTSLNALETGNGAGVYTSTNSVVKTTMTILGEQFSIGGSSFSVVGGSATVAYRLQAKTLVSDIGIWGNTHKSTMTFTGIFAIPSWTLAQIRAYTPTTDERGGLISCLDCSGTFMVCKATGTTINAFQLSTGTVASASPCR